MLNFFKNNKKLEFNELENYEFKNKYFYRIAEWSWLNNQSISVIDSNKSRVITMDEWPQLVFLEANGDKTIEEFIYVTAAKYKKVPKELDKVILYQITQLLKEKLINLSDVKINFNLK